MMYTIIWDFRAAANRRGEFDPAYARGGKWAQLFAQASGYIGTKLLRDGRGCNTIHDD